MWTAPGGTNATNCHWACSLGAYLVGQTCPTCLPDSWCTANTKYSCPADSTTQSGASSQSQCLCTAGFRGDGSTTGTSPCTLCSIGSYCPGGNGNISTLCPGNSSSGAGSAALVMCQCSPGYVGPNGGPCTLCPKDSVCLSGNLTTCAANSQAPAGSSGNCSCIPGFYSAQVGGPCQQCPANSYCAGGVAITRCASNQAVSPAGSALASSCYCDVGYLGVNNSACATCPADNWCYLGVSYPCPANTNTGGVTGQSYYWQCLCASGYVGSNGISCTPCAPGSYKPVRGNGTTCQACDPNTFVSTPGASSCAAATSCPGGQYANPATTSIADNVCVPCMPSYFCQANIQTPCPGGSVSPPNSTTFLNCSCPAGTAGQVSGADTGQCDPCSLGQFCPGIPCTCA